MAPAWSRPSDFLLRTQEVPTGQASRGCSSKGAWGRACWTTAHTTPPPSATQAPRGRPAHPSTFLQHGQAGPFLSGEVFTGPAKGPGMQEACCCLTAWKSADSLTSVLQAAGLWNFLWGIPGALPARRPTPASRSSRRFPGAPSAVRWPWQPEGRLSHPSSLDFDSTRQELLEILLRNPQRSCTVSLFYG